MLRDEGRKAARKSSSTEHADDLGKRSTLDIDACSKASDRWDFSAFSSRSAC